MSIDIKGLIAKEKYVLNKGGTIRQANSFKLDILPGSIVNIQELGLYLAATLRIVTSNIDLTQVKNNLTDFSFFTFVQPLYLPDNLPGWVMVADNSEEYIPYFFVVLNNVSAKIIEFSFGADEHVDWNLIKLGIALGKKDASGNIQWLNPVNDQDPIYMSVLQGFRWKYSTGTLTAPENLNSALQGVSLNSSMIIPKVIWNTYTSAGTNWAGKKYIPEFLPSRSFILVLKSDGSADLYSIDKNQPDRFAQAYSILENAGDENVAEFYDVVLLYAYTGSTPASKLKLTTVYPYMIGNNPSKYFYFSNLFEADNSITPNYVWSAPKTKTYKSVAVVGNAVVQQPSQTDNWVEIYSGKVEQELVALHLTLLKIEGDISGSTTAPEIAISIKAGTGKETAYWIGSQTINVGGSQQVIFARLSNHLSTAYRTGMYLNLVEGMLHYSLKELKQAGIFGNLYVDEIKIYVNTRRLRQFKTSEYYGGVLELHGLNSQSLGQTIYTITRSKAAPIYMKVSEEYAGFIPQSFNITFGEVGGASGSVELPLIQSTETGLYSNSPLTSNSNTSSSLQPPSSLADFVKVGSKLKLTISLNKNSTIIYQGLIDEISFGKSALSIRSDSFSRKLESVLYEPYPTILYKKGTKIIDVLKDIMFIAGFTEADFDFDSSMSDIDKAQVLQTDIQLYNKTFKEILDSFLKVLGYELVMQTNGKLQLRKYSWFNPIQLLPSKISSIVKTTNPPVSVSFAVKNEALRNLIVLEIADQKLIVTVEDVSSLQTKVDLPSIFGSLVHNDGIYKIAKIGFTSKLSEIPLGSIDTPQIVELLVGEIVKSSIQLNVEWAGIEFLKIGDFVAVHDPTTGLGVIGIVTSLTYSVNRTSAELETLLTPITTADKMVFTSFYYGGV